ncbi:transglutaminase family protein [Erythrobacteraceae bacterium CFH 75059]|uniref:transglutaminase-like domain-containing protein n=1 Tax=Qipengyuania thermophila TaxID=2509361 RepID=UPI001021A9F2|nr:transglutaminase family protein [Qipengyuania thermophila]TCD04118.1 transglutaminase family protein [Erythrobacteraceae bacterium CFH 75059]
MTVSIQSSFAFRLQEPTDVLLQFEAAAIPEQEIVRCETTLSPAEHLARVGAQDNIGQRIWIRATGEFEVGYRATVKPRRLLARLDELERLPPHRLPGHTVPYLFDSRYCAADKFQSFVQAEWGHLDGGARIVAMRDWIAENFTYQAGTSDATTGASDSFIQRCGICRDFAHVMIALTRASAIPARYVACYDPGVNPPDFHAVAEVFLADPTIPGGGAWHLVDATRMADPAQTVKIGVGRDAADVSFMTSFGNAEFLRSRVEVRQGGDE